MDKKHRILLVDDQSFIRHIYSRELSESGYDVHCCESGEEALETIKLEEFDLVLLDMIMPGLSGLDVCKKIRTFPMTKNLPIIFLTANSDKKTVIRAIQAGANDFAMKSVDVNQLLAKVDKFLKKEA